MKQLDQKQMLQKMQANLSEMAKDPIDFQFKRCLKKAKEFRSPLQKGIVKDNFIKSAYFDVMLACNIKLNHFSIDQTNPTINLLVFDEDRMVETIYQYHLFHTGHLNDKKRVELQNNSDYKNKLVAEVSGYLTSGTIGESRMLAPTVPLSPEIWSYCVVCDRFLLIHTNFNRELEQYENIAVKLMHDAFSSIKGTVQLLATGQNTCAVTLWRHLHEVECISLIILKYGKDAILAYYDHQRYAEIDDNDSEFVSAIEKFKDKIGQNKNGFKNYGWLLQISDFIDNWSTKGYRLDMRNGLQKFAGLATKESGYKTASKILHPTALMLSVSPEQYYVVTMELLYDTTMNIIDTYGAFICESKMLNQKEYWDFRNSVEMDSNRLKENIEIIRQKFPRI